MVNASELRIGNLLNPVANSIVLSQEVHTVEPTTLMILLGQIDSRGITFHPIPLTEEWLIKFGFEKQPKKIRHGNGQDWTPEYPQTHTIDFVRQTKDIDCPCIITYETFYWVNKDGGIEVDNETVSSNLLIGWGGFAYVHKLQNLFFALTGEELTIKEA